MKASKSYLQNSFDIIKHLESTSYPTDTVIFMDDVISLYPSINIEDSIIQMRKVLQKFTTYSNTEIDFFFHFYHRYYTRTIKNLVILNGYKFKEPSWGLPWQ